jgi:thiol-disulfide isomerase/thioredoxin
MRRPKPSRLVARSGRARLAAAAVVLSVLTGCGSADGESSAIGGNGNAGNAARGGDISTGLTRWNRAERLTLPRLRGPTLGGSQLDVSNWSGRVVVVNTWGSWCGPCREEARDLARAYQDTKGEKVRFVGIDTRDNDAAAKAFVREFAVGYPSLVDNDGRLMLALGRTIPVSAVPSTVVVDTRGRIAARVIGAVTYGTLTGLIEDALTEPRRPAREPATTDEDGS